MPEIRILSRAHSLPPSADIIPPAIVTNVKQILTIVLFALLARAQAPLGELSSQFQSLVQRTSPAVVQIVVRAYAADGDNSTPLIRTAKGNGSGTIVSADGFIITNAHVVANARRIQVLLPITTEEAQTRRSILKTNGKLVDATLVGQDRETDIAVLKLDQTVKVVVLDFDGDVAQRREARELRLVGARRARTVRDERHDRRVVPRPDTP